MNHKCLYIALFSSILSLCACQELEVKIYLPEPECGNGVLEAEEACDGEDFGGKTCVDFKGEGATGSLQCSSTCTIDDTACVAAAPAPSCGNGVLDGEEACDGKDFGGKTCADFKGEGATGSLECTSTCTIDDTACVSVAPAPQCGNGVLEGEESCDGKDFGGKTCADFKGEGATGSLECTSTCTIDDTACKAPVISTCGNDQLDEGEVCDGTHMAGMNCAKVGYGYTGVVKCLDDCTDYDLSDCKPQHPLLKCGDGVLDDDEYCDGDQIRGGIWYTCKAYFGPGSEGTISCKDDCLGLVMDCTSPYTIGDGTRQINEKCDPGIEYTDVLSCENVYGNDITGGRSCNTLGRWDNSACMAPDHCGNGIIEPELGEECEPGIEMTLGKNCQDSFGPGSWGHVACSNFCRISYSGCFPGSACGDGSLDNGQNGTANYNEVCDSDNLNKRRCSTLGAGYSGNLKCLNNCSGFDFSDCEYTPVDGE